MKKQLISLLCALTILACTLPASALEGDSQRAAESLAAIGLVQKSQDYRLDAGATRLEALTILARLTGARGGKCPYTDVPAWAVETVGAVSTAGYLAGIYDGPTLHGSEFITTDEWCAMLLHLAGKSTTLSDAALCAQRLGMISRDYGSPLTRGQLFELTKEALGYCGENGESLAGQMVKKGLCTRETLEAYRICPTALTAREAADRHMAAIARIATYASESDYQKGRADRDASAFFISADGIAVTNYHAIADTAAATATLTTGEVFPVEGVLWANEAADLAVIRISRSQDKNSAPVPAFACLALAGGDEIRAGDIVYALGNPLGLGHSVSCGVIGMTTCRSSLSSEGCIVSSAAISSGSSGGALVNEFGHVIGVTAGSFTDGNDMYLSIPTDLLMQLDLSAAKVVPLSKLDTLS